VGKRLTAVSEAVEMLELGVDPIDGWFWTDDGEG